MRLLIIGGSIFLGRALTEEALRRGDTVTTFNRGRSGVDLPGVETVRGDREDESDLARLVDGRHWDAVVDVCGYTPRVVGRSAHHLSGHADTYTFVSTISVYRDFGEVEVDEHARQFECAVDEGPGGEYGVLKAGCEYAVEQAFAGRVLIVQPGLILGPHENVGRLPWWLRRIAKGGPVLAPGDPDLPVQLIDARDIAAFTLARIDAGATGRYLTGGVRGRDTFGSWLNECVRATGSDAELVWVPDEYLLENEVEPWSELPLWSLGGTAWHTSSAKAAAEGLRCRPLGETVDDTWAWLKDLPGPVDRGDTPPHRLRHGIDPEKEERILAGWRHRS
ncbi:NAD-dependent epimerase/dehydratase family protein [Rhizohabitans arisaemae]|uniref:NAD-dependent epimerase/dehydratase family protein n=1 Tax=Rhizohabitans arisaemae TaxID=2720610 RepID=UPI0024B14E6E|nr:NAD-dependent epimerase/dehydratase family protein [Rhizohabitans arisaemae]